MSSEMIELAARALYGREAERERQTAEILSDAARRNIPSDMEPWEECAKMYLGDARAAILAIEQGGYVIVPREPTPEMVAATLPMAAQPTRQQVAIAKRALALLPPIRVEQYFQGETAAAELVRDWQAMIDAAGRAA